MSVTEFLQTMSGMNIHLRLEQDALKVNAPKGVMTKELQERLVENKDNIVDWLKRSQANVDDDNILPLVEKNDNDRFEPFPLSDLQVAFYLANDSFMEFQVRPHYYMEDSHTDLDIARYEMAWNKALRRHHKELVLVNNEGQLQAIESLPPLKIKVNDFRSLNDTALKDALLCVRNSMMRCELPLNRWPWFDLQVSVWHGGETEQYRIHYNNNNFFSDGLGTTKLMKEIWAYYANPDLIYPALDLSFRDAVLSLERLEQSPIGQKSKEYWLSRMGELPPAPPIPLISGKDHRCRSKLKRREFSVDKKTWQLFKENCVAYGITASNAILVAYAKVLATWSGSNHFILSYMMTQRLPIHPHINDILGNFASLYPLEVDFRDDESFVTHTLRIQQQVLADNNHVHWGGMKVMRELNRLKGEMGASPSPYVVGSGMFIGGYNKPEFACLETSQTLLDHQFWELVDGSFYAVWDLLDEFFPEGMIDSMWNAYQRLFLQLANDREHWKAHNFNLVVESDLFPRQQHNQSIQSFSRGLLHSGLSSLAKENLSRQALITSSGSLSYGELDRWSRGIAARLLEKGVKGGDKVALVMDRGPELLVALMGIVRVGGTYVPINPELPQERRAYLVSNSHATCLLTQTKYESESQFDDIVLVTIAGEERDLTLEQVLPEVSEFDLAYIIYTSGSTGLPKGVAIDHRGAVNTIKDINHRFNVSSEDKIFGVSAYSFDLSVYDVFGALDSYATLVYPDPDAAFNPVHWLEMIVQYGVTIWNSAPPLMSLLVEAALRQKITLPTVRLVMLSGDWIPLKLPDDILKIAPNAEVVSLGGATEASIWSIYYPINEVRQEWISIPYGYPLTNQHWHILDHAGNPVPIWTPGELYIGGASLAVSYWDDEEKTAKSFIYHQQTGERLYKTGDQGRYLPDGCIEFLGRLDSQVKIQGHRIELGEIESAIRSYDGIAEVIVVAQEGEQKHDKHLVAYVIPESDYERSPAEFISLIEAHLKHKLPLYMLPKMWSVLSAFPVTVNGKIDREALARIEHVDISENRAHPVAMVVPRSETEQVLLELWSQVLPEIKFGVYDDFFDLGGQSFDAVRVMGMVQEHFGRPLSLGDMWHQRTIENLAKLLDDESEQGIQCLVSINTQGVGEPWFLVHPAGGYCVRYAELSERLLQPVFGFQAIGVDGRESPLTSIAEMASFYIEEMRKQQPHGPYRIGGWSSGGLIAFEMACQLRKQGKTVRPLLIMDCPSPHEHNSISRTEMLNWFFEDLALDLPLSVLKGDNWDDLDNLTGLEQAIAKLAAAGVCDLDASLLLPLFNVFSNVVVAGRNYYPEVHDIDMVLCRAEDGQVSEFSNHPHKDRDDWGWSLLTSGSVNARLMSGTHHTLLAKKNVGNITHTLYELEAKYEC